jgi:hypothetical protein
MKAPPLSLVGGEGQRREAEVFQTQPDAGGEPFHLLSRLEAVGVPRCLSIVAKPVDINLAVSHAATVRFVHKEEGSSAAGPRLGSAILSQRIRKDGRWIKRQSMKLHLWTSFLFRCPRCEAISGKSGRWGTGRRSHIAIKCGRPLWRKSANEINGRWNCGKLMREKRLH